MTKKSVPWQAPGEAGMVRLKLPKLQRAQAADKPLAVDAESRNLDLSFSSEFAVERSVEVDTPADLLRAESYLKRRAN